ncbi:hypothetical protein ACHQM5_002750 [Ranunculus cassubicifolius]
MNRFHLCLLLAVILLSISPTLHASRKALSPSIKAQLQQQVFHPPITTTIGDARDIESEKRRVPTGPNPLHNRR